MARVLVFLFIFQSD